MGGGSWCPTSKQLAEALTVTEEFRRRLETEFHVRPILCLFWFPKEDNCQVLVGTGVPKFALVPLLSFAIANAGYTPGEVRRFVSWYRSGGILSDHPDVPKHTRRVVGWLFGDESQREKHLRAPYEPLVEALYERLRHLGEKEQPLVAVRDEELLALRDFLTVALGEKG